MDFCNSVEQLRSIADDLEYADYYNKFMSKEFLMDTDKRLLLEKKGDDYYVHNGHWYGHFDKGGDFIMHMEESENKPYPQKLEFKKITMKDIHDEYGIDYVWNRQHGSRCNNPWYLTTYLPLNQKQYFVNKERQRILNDDIAF
jgi:hypothetical protein